MSDLLLSHGWSYVCNFGCGEIWRKKNFVLLWFAEKNRIVQRCHLEKAKEKIKVS
ncbi:hypothetical protein M0R04_13275 [Candidatus Dojkabacteria bacterium]|jgi:hypothetical protein|nr:hypothetical protein [Candidatus Dojkabacteria bacterium]